LRRFVSERTEPVAGRNPVLEALRANRPLARIYLAEGARADASVTEIRALAEEAGVPVESAPTGKLERLAGGTGHQGVVAMAVLRTAATVDDMLATARARSEDPFLILLDHVEDPHNLGAVLRVADGAGAHGVIIPTRRAVGVTPGVYKASAGAAEHVPVAEVTKLVDAVTQLKRAGVWVGAAEAGEGKPYYAERLTGPIAIVLGGEDKGVSRPVMKHADFTTHIPLRGKVNSLNVSVATAILAFERVRQLSQKRK
jgi:23S rRNA (guanosine2251-2'-O)-methyltransferase